MSAIPEQDLAFGLKDFRREFPLESEGHRATFPLIA